MKRYRILVIVRHPVGGIRTFFRYVYKNFHQKGYQFTLVAPDLPETRVLLDDLKALDLTYVPAPANVSNRELSSLVTNVTRTAAFDLIHSHGFTSGACSVFVALCNGTPHMITCHDVFTRAQFIGLIGFLKRVGLGIMLSFIDCIHCVSDDARDNLLEYLPILRLFKRKVISIPNGIEGEGFLEVEGRDLRAEFGLPGNAFLIGFLGRFMSQKGFRYLLDALELIKQEKSLPKEPLLLAFSGQDGFIREEKENVRMRGLAKSVLFLPFVPHVGSTLKGLDIVAMPSQWEACGLLAMEAMTAGVPFVGTNCVGLREVLRNTPAYVVPAGNSLALSEALIKELKTPTTARAREFAVEAAIRFEVKERAKAIENLMLTFIKI
jgi:glycosyltransferase involved in cell wall biosynthesis